MQKKYVVTATPSGEPLALMGKQEAHEKGVLHLAFSVFIFRFTNDEPELLLQQRALSKYHSAGLWTNTCCSHAEPDTPVVLTAQKRLQEEMGFSCPLQPMGTFLYKADVGPGMIEHEIDYVFAALHNPTTILPDPEEAASCRWVPLPVLQERLLSHPHEFTAWFAEAFALAVPIILTSTLYIQ